MNNNGDWEDAAILLVLVGIYFVGSAALWLLDVVEQVESGKVRS